MVYFKLINEELTFVEKFRFDALIHEFTHLIDNSFLFILRKNENFMQIFDLKNNQVSLEIKGFLMVYLNWF